MVRAVAAVPNAYLIVAGQEASDTPATEDLARELMDERAIFVTLAQSELLEAYAAASVLALGSIFETFGTLYIEAMVMGLPAFCTDRRNQQAIVEDAVFVDIKRAGQLREALEKTTQTDRLGLRNGGRQTVLDHYDLQPLKKLCATTCEQMSKAPGKLPAYSYSHKLKSDTLGALHSADKQLSGRAE